MLRSAIGMLFGLFSIIFQPLTNVQGWRPAWGLDRIDQRESILDDTYRYTLTGSGVNVYVFDSGINSSHEEFRGRVDPGYNVVGDGYGTEDCSGHGSHSASLIGGNTYGVAKEVRLIPVRVLNCSNSNPSSAAMYPAFDWIIEHHKTGTPAVVNLSVGMPKSTAFNEAIVRLINDGLVVVGAAGNQSKDACLYSPASEPLAIVVGGTDRADLRGIQSNYGACIDIFAPGWDLVGAWSGATDVYRSSSGTSNSAPIVSGIAALMLEENPNLTQAQVKEKLVSNATSGALFNIGPGSPNLLAYAYLGTNEVSDTLPINMTSTTPVSGTTTTTLEPATTTVVPTTVSSTAPTVATTTTAPNTTVVTTQTALHSPSSRVTVPLPPDSGCHRPAERGVFYGVPYVCVNTGNRLMWIPQRYSPGRP